MDSLNVIYYTEVNLICIVIVLLLRSQLRHKSGRFSTEMIILNRLMITTVVLCVSDIFCGSLMGLDYPGSGLVLEICNIIFFEAGAVISYLWVKFASVKLKTEQELSTAAKNLMLTTLIIFTLIILSNPFTHIVFTISEGNIYSRSFGVVFHWIVVWGYLIFAFVKTLLALLHEKNKNKRQEIYPLLYFIIAPVIASAVQILFYGITSVQVGITISMAMVCISIQNSQILTDELTGLNNRRGFNNYLDDHSQHYPESKLTLMMIDLDNFKQVNDKHGHMMGDYALQSLSGVLKQVCRDSSQRLFLCRYGGDEFVIAGIDFTPKMISSFKDEIHKGIEAKAKELDFPFPLTVSIGYATGICSDFDDSSHLLRVADEAMYDDKKPVIS